jgi:hypothetical protein
MDPAPSDIVDSAPPQPAAKHPQAIAKACAQRRSTITP